MVLFRAGGYCSDSRQGSSRSGLSFIYNSANDLECINLVLLLRKFVKIMEPCVNKFDITLLNSKKYGNSNKGKLLAIFSSMNSTLIFFQVCLNPISAGHGKFDLQHHAYVCSFNKSQNNVTKIGDFVFVTI